MPILNYDNIPFLWTWARPRNSPANSEPPNHIVYRTGYYWYDDFKNSPDNYIIILFMHHDAFHVYPLDTLLSLEQIHMLRTGELTLVLENSGHGYNQNVGGIYKDIVLKYDIHPRHILLRTESADMHDEVRLISQHLDLPELKVDWVHQFEYQMHGNALEYEIPNTLQLKHYDKKFLSYNGLFRMHRGILIHLLYCYGLLDKGYVSYCIKDDFDRPAVDAHVNLFKELYENYPDICTMLEANRNELCDNLVKITLDDWSEKNTAGHYEIDNHYYENTYFSLVTETSFPTACWSKHYPKYTDTGRILSEKIFKPILNKHPFILASNYQSLALLKSLGYKSFHPYIDESYDEIRDDKLRLITIAKEVKRLAELSGSALEEFLINCKEIVEYNFQILRTKNYFYHKLNY